jgi:hypothetical protein
MSFVAEFTAPLSDADRCAAAAILAAVRYIRVAGVSLHLDTIVSVVWGCDEFGQDFVAARAIDAHGCMIAVESAIDRARQGSRRRQSVADTERGR